jgi:hypothetical protein
VWGGEGDRPEETAEEVRPKPKGNLSCGEEDPSNPESQRGAHGSFADTGSATVVLDTADYNRMVAALLEDHAYRKSKKDNIESVERKTVHLQKKFSISEEVSQQLRQHDSKPMTPCGLPKIHTQGALTLKTEAVCSCDTSVDFQRTTLRYIPEDNTLQN